MNDNIYEHIKSLPVEIQDIIWKIKYKTMMNMVIKEVDITHCKYKSLLSMIKHNKHIGCIFRFIWMIIFNSDNNNNSDYDYNAAYSDLINALSNASYYGIYRGSVHKRPEMSDVIAYRFGEIMGSAVISGVLNIMTVKKICQCKELHSNINTMLAGIDATCY